VKSVKRDFNRIVTFHAHLVRFETGGAGDPPGSERLLAELRAAGGGPIETSGLRRRGPLDDRRSYVVVTNGLLAGGNQFPALRAATGRRRIGTDLQALVSWLSRPAASRATASLVASPRSRAPVRSRRPR
jgi:hypothetical protein